MVNKPLHKLQEKHGTAKDVYKALLASREKLEQEWRDCSMLTLPYVFPDDDLDESTMLPTPYNSIGPSAVNTLASKLLLALLPPTGNFFRLLPNEEDVEGFEKEALDQLDKELSKLEQDVNTVINTQALRVPLYEALKLLIITGNTLLYKIPGGSIKVFSPYQYVVNRDYAGNPITMCIKEKVSKRVLPKNIVEMVTEAEDTAEKDKKDLEIYTIIQRVDRDKYEMFQEINGFVLETSIKTYNQNTLPYLPLRWTSIANENYGRGLVEQYLGDLRSLEGLTQMIVEGGGIMAKTVFGLKPAASTKIEDLNNAANGDFVEGDLEKDVTVLQVNKAADLKVPYDLMMSLEQRLAKAFLLLQGQVRDSERTTATEVRAVANELEMALGGTFSVLSQELQLPLLRLLLDEIEPKILEVTTPTISTGISAISRERDYQNLNTLASTIVQFGPEAAGQYLDMSKFFSKIAIALGMEPDEIVKSQEQIQAEQQQAMAAQQAMMQQEQQQQMQQIEAKKE
jgi:hypothetical protein